MRVGVHQFRTGIGKGAVNTNLGLIDRETSMNIDFSDIEPADEGEVGMMVVENDYRLYRITNDPKISFKAFAISDVICLILMSKDGGPYNKCYRVCNVIGEADLDSRVKAQFDLQSFNPENSFTLLKACLTEEYLEECEMVAEYWVGVGEGAVKITDSAKLSTVVH